VKAAEQNYIARVDLAFFGFPDHFEQIWLGALEGGLYEIRCIPFRAYGLALGDVVTVSPDGSLINALVRPSGRKVLRVLLDSSLAGERRSIAIDSLNVNVEAAGLLFEWSEDRHIAIDIPLDANSEELFDFVCGYVERGEAFWEWGDAEPFGAS
jgi:hypothetical protein